MKTLYYYIYYRMFRLQIIISPNNVPLCTTILTLSLLQNFIILDILLLLSKLIDDKLMIFIKPEYIFFHITYILVLFALNYFGILYKGKYRKYFKKFRKETKTQRKFATLLLIVCQIFITFFAIFYVVFI
jgi:hypothetical protein